MSFSAMARWMRAPLRRWATTTWFRTILERRLADPCWAEGEQDFLLRELRRAAAVAGRCTDSYGAHAAEITGDFSMSGAKIYDPTAAVANPTTIRRLPTDASNFPYTRSSVSENQIPMDRINPRLEAFLMQYAPMPNMGAMSGMMMSSGADSNNYLDMRNEIALPGSGDRAVRSRFLATTIRSFVRYSLGIGERFLAVERLDFDDGNLRGLDRKRSTIFPAGGDFVEPRVFEQQAEYGFAGHVAPVDEPHVAE